MNREKEILLYAGYSAYIASHALSECGGFPEEMVHTEKLPQDLTLIKCRWLIREFNNNCGKSLFSTKWERMFSALNNKISVKIEDFTSVKWDEKAVLFFYEEIAEKRNLMTSLGNIAFAYGMDLADAGQSLGISKNKLGEFIRRGIWIPKELLDAIRKSMPADEGFPGRFQINTRRVDL